MKNLIIRLHFVNPHGVDFEIAPGAALESFSQEESAQ